VAAQITSDIPVEIDIEADVELDIEAAADADIEIDVELDVEAAADADIEADVEADIEVDIEVDIEAAAEAILETKPSAKGSMPVSCVLTLEHWGGMHLWASMRKMSHRVRRVATFFPSAFLSRSSSPGSSSPRSRVMCHRYSCTRASMGWLTGSHTTVYLLSLLDCVRWLLDFDLTWTQSFWMCCLRSVTMRL
jgi:hypothetical protein